VRVRVVDAFAEQPFTGNPAGVCLLDAWPEDAWMQRVAAELNLSETAFAHPRADGDSALRWFTPTVEVDLCGHATLAAAHVLRTDGLVSDTVRFHTRSGVLTARSASGSRSTSPPRGSAAIAST
jgi:PhzF family phenazine biosynthesis protein